MEPVPTTPGRRAGRASRALAWVCLLLLLTAGLAAWRWWRRSGDTPPVPVSTRPWAACAITLGPPAPQPPGWLADDPGWQGAVKLDHFWQRAGRGEARLPTLARVTWDQTALYVGVDCGQAPGGYRPEWSVATYDPNVEFPDRVEVQFCLDWTTTIYRLLVRPNGSFKLIARPMYYWQQEQHDEEQPQLLAALQLGLLVQPEANGTWHARLALPWAALGGRPTATFGLNVARFADQEGEQSSPMALDWLNVPGPGTLLEASFGAAPQVHLASAAVTPLPSGTLVWQRSPVLTRPTAEERAALATLQRSLRHHTTSRTLGLRLAWAERWQESLVCDGFSFFGLGNLWEVRPHEYHPPWMRVAVCKALRAGRTAEACRLADTYLAMLDRATRKWYADGTVGDVDTRAWTSVDRLDPPQPVDGGYRLLLRAGRHALPLDCEFVELDGVAGVRLSAQPAGGYTGGKHLPITVAAGTRDGETLVLRGGGLTLGYRPQPWRLRLAGTDGVTRWTVGQGDLALLYRLGRVAAIDLRGPLTFDEAVAGFGERFDSLDQHGKVVPVWNEDCWDGAMRGIANQAFKPVPLVHSSRGWSLFWDTSYRLLGDIGATDREVLRLTAHGPVLDWWLWPTGPREAGRAYSALTGRTTVPAPWAFEPWMGGNFHRWDAVPGGDRTAALLDTAREYRQRDLPLRVAYLEDKLSSDPRMLPGLAELGLKGVAWTDPLLLRQGRLAGLPDVGPKDDLWLRLANGTRTELIDFSRPEAADYLRRAWAKRLDDGLAGFMVDYGDTVAPDAVLADGRRGDEAHNRYGSEFAQAYHDLLRSRRGGDGVVIGRPLGVGAQRWAVAFGGDQPATFAGMRMQLAALLSSGVSGFHLWTGDIGGFQGVPDSETYVRWLQFGTFHSLMRLHGWAPREPWLYGAEAERQYRFYAWLRLTLQPYLYRSACDAAHDGVAMLRGLLVDWPELPGAWTCGDEFLCGRDLLVCPITARVRERAVLLPPGRWTDVWTGERLTGPRKLTADARLDRLPLYWRSGAVVPLNLTPELRWGESLALGSVPAVLVTAPDAEVAAHYHSVPGSAATARLSPTEGGFVLSLPEDWPCEVLVLTGERVRHVRSQGQELPLLPRGAWTVVRLPGSGARSVTVLAD